MRIDIRTILFPMLSLSPASDPVSRRRFLQATATAGLTFTLAVTSGIALGPHLAPPLSAAPAEKRRYRAAIIGRTGGGDYGHGWDEYFRQVENVDVVGVADPNPEGAAKAALRSGATKTYTEYSRMIAEQKPDIVGILFRQPRGHLEAARFALEAGAHLFLEKPFTETLPEADALHALAIKHQKHIIVAHNRRWMREFVVLRSLLRDGFLGSVREVHIHGKQDSRAGGEDLMVLGTHDFDILRFFFGDPLWCSATVLNKGRLATRAEIHDGQEPIRVAGDTVRAMFGFGNNITATWESVTTPDDWNKAKFARERWSFEIIGSKRIVAYQPGFGFGVLESPFHAHKDATGMWQSLPATVALPWLDYEQHPVQSLVHAIETGQRTLCDADDARWTIEMVSAVYRSHFDARRVELPLKDRSDPLV